MFFTLFPIKTISLGIAYLYVLMLDSSYGILFSGVYHQWICSVRSQFVLSAFHFLGIYGKHCRIHLGYMISKVSYFGMLVRYLTDPHIPIYIGLLYIVSWHTCACNLIWYLSLQGKMDLLGNKCVPGS